jgi:membrane protease YdiL (CAAX protease family)
MTEPTPTLPPPASPAHGILHGPNGLRAGWRVLIFLLIVAGQFVALFAVTFLAHARPSAANATMLTPLGLGLSEGIILVFASIAALIMGRIEHRPFGDYGLPAKYALGSHFWTGVLVGFVSISACLLVIFALHGFRISGFAISGATILTSTLAWTLTFLIVGLSEEFAFRGYMQFTLTTGIGFWPAAIFLSLSFGLAHAGNPGETKMGLLSVVCFGLLFCLFLRRTGNLWWAVGFHAGWDWGQTFFYGVHDSGIPAYHNLLNSSFDGPSWLTGGSVGPEASVFTPIALGMVAILFSRRYRENRYRPLV